MTASGETSDGPPLNEMRKVMREVTAGLLELCVSVVKETSRSGSKHEPNA